MSFPSITATETYLNNRIAAESKTRDAMTSAMAKCDDAIVEDLTADERETLTAQLAHEDENGTSSEPLHPSTARALKLAGLVERAVYDDDDIMLTIRGQRIARRLSA